MMIGTKVPHYFMAAVLVLSIVACQSSPTEPPNPPTETPTQTATDNPTPTMTIAPTATPTERADSTPFLTMSEWSTFAYGVEFNIEVPDEWSREINAQADYTTITFTGDVALFEIYLAALEGYESLHQYVEIDIQYQQQQVPEFELISWDAMEHPNGYAVEIMTANQNLGTPMTMMRMYYLHESGAIFAGTYYVLASEFETYTPLIAYSFGTFNLSE